MDELLQERYRLSFERIQDIVGDPRFMSVNSDLGNAFSGIAGIYLYLCRLSEKCDPENGLEERTVKNAKNTLFNDLFGESYKKTFCNPDHAVETLGSNSGKLISLMYLDALDTLSDITNGHAELLTMQMERFLEIYCIYENLIFEKENSEEVLKNAFKEAKEAYSSFETDLLPVFLECEILDVIKGKTVFGKLKRRSYFLNGDRKELTGAVFCDHAGDAAFYYDKVYAERMLEATENILNDNIELADSFTGVLKLGNLDNSDLSPEEGKAGSNAIKFTDHQKKLLSEYENRFCELIKVFVKPEGVNIMF